MVGAGLMQARKPLTVESSPSCKITLCTFCTTGFDCLVSCWLALAQVGSLDLIDLSEVPAAAECNQTQVIPRSRS